MLGMADLLGANEYRVRAGSLLYTRAYRARNAGHAFLSSWCSWIRDKLLATLYTTRLTGMSEMHMQLQQSVF